MKNTNDIELLKEIIKTKSELNIANKNFEIAEEELIDYYSYKIKANKAKLDYLIKSVKKQGIILEMVNEIQMNIENREVI